jgi:hypothetical protein
VSQSQPLEEGNQQGKFTYDELACLRIAVAMFEVYIENKDFFPKEYDTIPDVKVKIIRMWEKAKSNPTLFQD